MASSGNTWQKKLMAKGRKYSQRHARKRFALTFTLENASKGTKPKDPSKVKYLMPLKEGFNPGRGRKGTLSREFRAAVETRKAKREEFMRGLRQKA